MECSGVQWSEVECSVWCGVEWSEVECNRMSGMGSRMGRIM